LLGELFTEGFAHALDSPTNSAAFQLAVWEIRYETGSPTDPRAGSFHVLSDNGHTTTVDAANYLLTRQCYANVTQIDRPSAYPMENKRVVWRYSCEYYR
jgi:hypothetical protein